MNENLKIFDLQAKFCQTLGHSVRLRIINLLKEGPQCVTSIAKLTDIPQPTISRHLNVLRSAGILSRERKGLEVFYEITIPTIVEVCDLMREVLSEQESLHAEIFKSLHK